MVNLARAETFVYLVYLDDSNEEPYQLVTALIVPDTEFLTIESYLGHAISQLVPEELRDDFEFHASKMFHLEPPFDKLSRDEVLEIFSRCAHAIEGVKMPVVYGAVNMRKLRATHYATARPVDVAFRCSMDGLAKWFDENSTQTDLLGMLICDNSNAGIRDAIYKAFRAYRKKVTSTDTGTNPDLRGKLRHIHDDMYFGDSGFSRGIQLADVCSYIILRHLQEKEDTEFLYKTIAPFIYFDQVEPA